MPIENEVKFVLDLVDPAESLQELISRNKYSSIYQCYIFKRKNVNCRIRKLTKNCGDSEYTMTTKVLLPEHLRSNNETIEIESKLDINEFVDISHIGKNHVEKIRVYVEDWEVDFFFDKMNRIYFVMAEHEMPSGQKFPNNITQFVKDNLLYVVEKNDKRFSSRKLSKVGRSKRLLKELRSKKA